MQTCIMGLCTANSSAKRVSLRRKFFRILNAAYISKLLCKTSQFEAGKRCLLHRQLFQADSSAKRVSLRRELIRAPTPEKYSSKLLCKTSQFEAVTKKGIGAKAAAANSSAKRVSLRRFSTRSAQKSKYLQTPLQNKRVSVILFLHSRGVFVCNYSAI